VSWLGASVGVVCLLLSGCGEQRDVDARASVPAPLNERELTWVRAYSAWAVTFWDEGFRPRPGAGVERVCLEQLDDAGRAPTKRLRLAEADARRVCSDLVQGSAVEAQEAAEAADDSLLPLLLEEQPLAVRSGAVTTASHIDLDLGLVAGKLSGEGVEVRCWSGPDWQRFIGESNVWNGEEDDHAEIEGRADVDSGRMHLLLEHCNLIVSLRREAVESRSREGLIDAGSALMTFAHEIGHFAEPDASEAEVECASYALAARLGPELTVERAEIGLLLEAYRDSVAPTLPNEYRDPSCAAAAGAQARG